MRYLKDAGLLHQVTDIASVSGGSILAAHLVSNWDRYTGDDARFDEAVSDPYRWIAWLCRPVGASNRYSLGQSLASWKGREFGDRPGFLFLPITSRVEATDDFSPLPPVVQAEVQSVRTDLDAFSATEIDTLAQHGYGVARRVCREHDFGDQSGTPDRPWSPYGEQPSRTNAPTDSLPREASSATAMALSLRASSRRKIWTRLLWLGGKKHGRDHRCDAGIPFDDTGDTGDVVQNPTELD